MAKYERLANYIMDYFPEPIYTTKDVTDWAKENVPAWSHISTKDRNEVVGDWEDFIQPKVESKLRQYSKGFIRRIRRFLGRLF